jgi:nucleoside-diphosphate-sugar epimerase
MNYLITGGCGFVGSNIAAYLLERGDSVVVFDNLSRLGAAANLAWLRYVAPDYPDGLDETIGLDSQTLLDWQPKVRREEGVRKVLAWLRTQPQSFPQSATAIRN